ncbi:UNVERIFIED_CONTAM: hypothetical protein Slati_4489800 [Sesamum latifolium]|uniref:Retrotransposon protein n=1 Tax=Sesamum latifolium TaxID=2727402 RepID=A0AAW2SUL4_9LAMI
MENKQREPSPLRSPCRGRGTPSAPEDNESRENGPQDMSIEEGHSSQASPPIAPPQRRRRDGEHVDREEESRGRRAREPKRLRTEVFGGSVRSSPLNNELLASILQQGLRRGPRREGLAEGQRHMPPDGFTRYTPLKAPRAKILMIAEQQGIVQWPRKMKDNPKRLKLDKYCRFHKDRGHSTEDCYHLKNEIEKLIQRGYLKIYVENKPSGHTSAHRRVGEELEEAESSRRRENLPTAGVIGVMTGGPAGGDSAWARKTLIRAASWSQEIDNYKKVTITGVPEKEIMFSSSDLEKGVLPHNNALVISATISNFWVKKVNW